MRYRIVKKYQPWGWSYVIQGKALGLFWTDHVDHRTEEEAKDMIQKWEKMRNTKPEVVWPI